MQQRTFISIIAISGLPLAGALAAGLSSCDRPSGYTEEEKLKFAKRCVAAEMVPDIHDNWAVCRKASQMPQRSDLAEEMTDSEGRQR